PHGPAAEHAHGVAVADLGDVRRLVTRREDVRDQDRLVVAHLVRQLHETDVRVRDARLLGLQAVEAARILGAAEERGPGALGIRVVALRVVPGAAVRTRAAGDRRRDHDAVAGVEIAHVFPYLLDDAHAFMTEDPPLLDARHR